MKSGTYERFHLFAILLELVLVLFHEFSFARRNFVHLCGRDITVTNNVQKCSKIIVYWLAHVHCRLGRLEHLCEGCLGV